MAHNDFTRPSGQWPNELVPGAGDYQRWDVAQSKILNAIDGGLWAPTRPIVLGGAGVQLASPNSSFASGFRTQTGGRFALGTYDIPALVPARTRKIVMDLVSLVPEFSSDGLHTYTTAGGTGFQLPPDAYLIGIPGPQQAGVLVVGVDAAPDFYIPVPREYLHIGANGVLTNGAQLSAITLNFRVVNRPSAAGFAAAVASPLTLGLVTPNGKNDPAGTPQGFIQQFTAFLAGGTQFLAGGAGPGQWGPSGPGLPATTGQYVLPIYPQALGRPAAFPSSYFRAAFSFNTHPSVEPSWNLTPGSSTSDNAGNWICVGQTGMFLPPNADTYWNQGNPQSLRMDLDLTLGTAQCLAEGNYYLLLENMPPSIPLPLNPDAIGILYHSIEFEFANIGSLYWG